MQRSFRRKSEECEAVGGFIRADELLTIGRFRVRLGLTVSAMTSMRRAGLPVIYFGKRAFVLGSRAIEFLERVGHGK